MNMSDYFPQSFIEVCDDDGIYYIRQLSREDGLPFEGIVWIGQRFDQDPDFVNVFIGRLKHGVRFDENMVPGESIRIDAWEGVYFDIPKGRVCATDQLYLESRVLDAEFCGRNLNVLIRARPSVFGGKTWPYGPPCWREAFDAGRIEVLPSPTPRLVEGIVSLDLGLDSVLPNNLANLLTSTIIPAGFEREAPNLTGQWRGNDGGTYYLNEPTGSDDVVWYAEHPSARPAFTAGSDTRSSQGWANVFWGKRVNDSLSGMWADVPRGATIGAGEMVLRYQAPNILNITSVTGGYGGRVLQRIKSLDLTVQVESLTINDPQERRDEPIIYLFFFKLDGDTVDIENLSSSIATTVPRPEIRFPTLDTGVSTPIPPEIGTYRTTLSSIRAFNGQDVSNETRIGVIAYAIERDNPRLPGARRRYNEFRQRRHEAWLSSQAWALSSALRDDRIPTQEELVERSNRILTRFRVGPTDDILSGDVQMVSLQDLLTTSVIEHDIILEGRRAEYSLHVRFEANNRINPECS